jgi:hypothetical protein
MQNTSLKDDPIGCVLERMWADLTVGGRTDVCVRIHECLAVKDYATAMMLAIALELDAAKREESEAFFSSENPSKPMALDEMGKRTLFSFLMVHRNDWRSLPQPVAVREIHDQAKNRVGPPPAKIRSIP